MLISTLILGLKCILLFLKTHKQQFHKEQVIVRPYCVEYLLIHGRHQHTHTYAHTHTLTHTHTLAQTDEEVWQLCTKTFIFILSITGQTYGIPFQNKISRTIILALKLEPYVLWKSSLFREQSWPSNIFLKHRTKASC